MDARALDGIRVLDLSRLLPGPFLTMVLADLGADVVRIDRPGRLPASDAEVLLRGRRCAVAADLKDPAQRDAVLALADGADVLVEGFRPGVMERLGLGPDVCLERNPRLVYGRMTGWGQDGPLASAAGHDIDYIALAGALDPIGRAGERPHAPLNLIGDFAGGGLLLAVGVLAALLERERSGRGQVVDAAMVDGSALLTAFLHGMIGAGLWSRGRGENTLDGGAPYYDTYPTADGGFVAVGALEPAFYRALLAGLGLSDAPDLPGQHDRSRWPELRERFARVFATRSRDEWAAIFSGSDACVAPVLSPTEAPDHPHHRARKTFVEVGGLAQPAPAPRFGRTPAQPPRPEAFRVGRDAKAIGDVSFS